MLRRSQRRGRQDRRLQDLAGRVVAAQGAVRQARSTTSIFPRSPARNTASKGVEFVNQFFKDKAHDSAYLKDLKKRANDVGVTCVLIMIDGEGDMSAPDKDERNKAVENHKKWVDAAAALGCHAIRINTGEHYSPTDVGAVAEACGMLTEYGVQHKHRDHLREPRRPVEQPRRLDRPDEGRGQADISGRCPTSATSPRRTASTRSTSTTPSPG